MSLQLAAILIWQKRLQRTSSHEPPTPNPKPQEATKWSPWAIAAAILLALLFGVIVVAGVRGCLTVDPKEAARLEEERKKK